MTDDPAVVLAEAASAAEEIDSVVAAAVVAEEETSAHVKCIKQYVVIVAKNVKCHSNQVMIVKETHDLYIAEIATKITKNTKK